MVRADGFPSEVRGDDSRKHVAVLLNALLVTSRAGGTSLPLPQKCVVR